MALGGSYVIENLHCSYWKVYEGGLFYPFSSIAFLKSLADIINHNHWGLEKTNDEIFEGFKSIYQVEIDNESLSLIHSVEFTDSVCTVRKLPRVKNVLGKRVISGIDASVIPTEDLGSRQDGESIIPSQQGNIWANRIYSPTDELLLRIHEMHQQKQKITQLEKLIDERDIRIEEFLEIL